MRASREIHLLALLCGGSVAFPDPASASVEIEGLRFLALDITFLNGDGFWTRTSDYSTVTLDPAEDRVALEVGASGSFALEDRVSASLAAAWRAPRDGPPSVQLTAAARVSLPGRFAITGVAMASDVGEDRATLGVLSLSRAFGARGQLDQRERRAPLKGRVGAIIRRGRRRYFATSAVHVRVGRDRGDHRLGAGAAWALGRCDL